MNNGKYLFRKLLIYYYICTISVIKSDIVHIIYKMLNRINSNNKYIINHVEFSAVYDPLEHVSLIRDK